MSLKMKIKKGDQVIVIAGDDKGKTGEVVKAMPSEGKVVVQGVNLVKRHFNTLAGSFDPGRWNNYCICNICGNINGIANTCRN